MDMAVNTHSVDLSQYDFRQLTTFEFRGRSIASARWYGIPDVVERVFFW